MLLKGEVKMISDRGYLFLKRIDGQGDVFCHQSAVSRAGIAGLEVGDKVEFSLAPGRNGKSEAADLVLIEKAA